MIAEEDFLVFANRTFAGFNAAVERLDDNTVNALPAIPAANSPYQLVVHTLAAVDWWTDHIILGNPSERDRPAEFEAAGTVAELRTALHTGQSKLRQLAPKLDAATEPAIDPGMALDGDWTVGACMIHVYEELAQHLGHLQITVDLVAAGSADEH